MNPQTSNPAEAPKFVAHATVCYKHGGKNFFRTAAATSPFSEDDARERARALASARAEGAAKGGRQSEQGDSYPYADRVLVEPVLERILFDATDGKSAQELGRITRNRYKASVLNTYNILFADVDTETQPSAERRHSVPESAAMDALMRVVQENPDLAFRVYATRAGLRYLCLTRFFDPVAAETQALFQRLLADPLYTTLCRVQKCFRARLTPKPWRCLPNPAKPSGFFARIFGISTRIYEEPARFSVCRYMDTVGTTQKTLPEIQRIVEIHDNATGTDTQKPLA
ncbi:MAG: hypothetical protein LBV28_02815 [Puniceicoccales bacterium]|jgi:hypothetical protein|nr:hypothetical protein [Puniceicoccales bacterium]